MEVTPDTLKEINVAMHLLSELNRLQPLSPEVERRIMQKFRLDWDFHSNNLEGNSLTYGETKAFLYYGITAGVKPFRDYLEIKSHNEAVSWALDIIKQESELSQKFIRELHQLILKEPYEVDSKTLDGKLTKKMVKVGEYKTTPNHVETVTGEIFYFATPEETPSKMADLVDWYNRQRNNPEVNPILLATEFHYKFIRIHPFDDGNGRTVRVLMNFILMSYGFPPVIIKTQDKKAYISALEQADSGLENPFVHFITKNIIDSLEIMIRGAKGESIEEDQDENKELLILQRRIESIAKDEKGEVKSDEKIRDLYLISISDLLKKFLAKNQLFDKFYNLSAFELIINNTTKVIDKEKIENDSLLEFFNKKIKKLRVYYQFNGLIIEGYEYRHHATAMEIYFGVRTYTVSHSHDTIKFTKSYGEYLSEEEVNKIINPISTMHKQKIEKLAEELEKARNKGN